MYFKKRKRKKRMSMWVTYIWINKNQTIYIYIYYWRRTNLKAVFDFEIHMEKKADVSFLQKSIIEILKIS